MRSATLMTILAAPLALAACDSGEKAADAETMPMSDEAPAIRSASAEGTVTAVDADAGTITIDHGPVAAVDWPAMTMAFHADEALRNEVAIGDDVAFDFQMSDNGSRITAIGKK